MKFNENHGSFDSNSKVSINIIPVILTLLTT